MANVTTRDRILDSALTLFSEKGFDGVGVDLIAEKAGLKGPSLYKHFKGKEEILDTLIDRVEEYYESSFGSEIHPGQSPSSMEELVDVSLKRIQFTMKDDAIQRTRRILTLEQFRNQRISGLTSRHNLEGVKGMYRKIFQEMMAAGVMRQADPEMLALSFTAPITLLIQMYDREPDREAEIMERIQNYFRFFAKEYAV